jgi:hypothetical protein
MDTSSTQFSQLISALNQRAGLALQASEGACAFLDRQGAYWQLSLGLGSDALVIQAALGPLAALAADDTPLQLLHLNADPALLRGAALGVDPVTAEIRLLHTVPLDGLDAARLESMLTNLMAVRDAVLARLDAAAAAADALDRAPHAVPPGLMNFA